MVSLSLTSVAAQAPERFAAAWEADHISSIQPSDVRHADLKAYVEQLKKLGTKIEQVGVSNASREIYQMEWGKGPVKVFMWSQMHGDEPTATSALIDMFAFFQKNKDDHDVKKLRDSLTIRAVPMLNPDGAEMYQRRNLQGIDINRDALDLKTPEARLLKQLRDAWTPEIGLNLHNQQALTTVGNSPMQAAISLLVVYGDEAKTTSPGHERNQRISAAIVQALQKYIPGHIGRYGDEWTPTAFGDNFSAWGTPTILIETGALHGRDELFLVKINFIAFLTALSSVASGTERSQNARIYIDLPENGSGGLVHYVFRGGTLFGRASAEPASAGDIAAVAERRRAGFVPSVKIRQIGPLFSLRGLEEYDASRFNVIQRFGRTEPGELSDLFFYKRDRTVDWKSTGLEKQFPPDAIFSAGKWVKGADLVPKK